MREFRCGECRTLVFLPSTVKTVSCRRCGETYFCNDGNPPRKFYPSLKMYPINALAQDGALSKWMPTHTRPILPGMYECRFRTTEPTVLSLMWDGHRFVTLDDAQRVAMRDFLSWRGVLA